MSADMEISRHSAFRAGPDVIVRELEGEMVLLNLASGVYFGLDRVGARVWQLVDEHATLDGVLAVMREEFDAPADVLERDVLRLVSELAGQGLVVARE
jgi:hypothetical protein